MADDDDIDDKSLSSMRAVWLSMRDEEPPAAGMSALLAAAREKAEQMQQPSLWQRVTALLRRPPALAFATVMILIGGAVLVTRNTQDKVESEVATAPAVERSGDNFGAREQLEAKATESQATGSATATIEPNATPAADPTPVEPPAVEKPADKPRRNRPAVGNKDVTKKTRVDDDEKYVKEEVDLGEGGKTPDRGLEGRGPTGGTTLDSPGRIEPATTTEAPRKPGVARPEPKPEPPAKITVKGGDAPEQEDAVDGTVILSDKAAGKQQTPPVEQLERQAASAAARGDCAAVRVIVERIKKQDANYYKTRVAKNAAIAKCL